MKYLKKYNESIDDTINKYLSRFKEKPESHVRLDVLDIFQEIIDDYSLYEYDENEDSVGSYYRIYTNEKGISWSGFGIKDLIKLPTKKFIGLEIFELPPNESRLEEIYKECRHPIKRLKSLGYKVKSSIFNADDFEDDLGGDYDFEDDLKYYNFIRIEISQ